MSLRLSDTALGIAPSMTLHLTAQAARMKKEGKDVISLCAGEPDFATPAPICAAAVHALENGHTRYTDAAGLPALRQAIAENIRAQKGLVYTPEEIIVSAGAKQVLYSACLALLNPGDQVLLPSPHWLSYPEIIRMAGGVPVPISTTPEHHFLPDCTQLAAAITPRTRALLINTPGNPTGAVWPRALLEDIMHLARAHDLFVISDEIYEQLVYDDCMHISPAQLSEDAVQRTIVVSGFSKTYAMTGWRVGYAAGPREIISAMAALQSHMTGSCNTMAQYAAWAALTEAQSFAEEFRRAFAARRDFLLQCIQAENLHCAVQPQGAFYLLLDVRPYIGKRFEGEIITDDVAFADLLLRYALVGVVPGAAFGALGCVRISYAVNEDVLATAAHRIGAFVRALQ